MSKICFGVFRGFVFGFYWLKLRFEVIYNFKGGWESRYLIVSVFVVGSRSGEGLGVGCVKWIGFSVVFVVTYSYVRDSIKGFSEVVVVEMGFEE